MMKPTDAKRMAHTLMAEHGLRGAGWDHAVAGREWAFQFDRARRRFGQCRHRDHVITLSEHLVRLNDEAEVRDTMLHEIAHALAGPGAGHGPAWKRLARAVGCSPTRTYDDRSVVRPALKWIGSCLKCGRKTQPRARRGDIACRACCGGVYDPMYAFVWNVNPEWDGA